MFIVTFFKLIIFGIVTFVSILGVMFFGNWEFPKEKIINAYNSFIEHFDTKGLSKDKDIQGKRTFGIDKYIGTYQAKYDNVTNEEVIFGGTSLNRTDGDHIKLKIKIEKQSGNINVINKLGAEEISLISDSGEYEDTVYIEGMSYYLVVKTEKFVGNIDIVSE